MKMPHWICAFLFCPQRQRLARSHGIRQARRQFDDASARLTGAALDQVESAVNTERAATDARARVKGVETRTTDRAEGRTSADEEDHHSAMRDQIDALVARQERRDRDH